MLVSLIGNSVLIFVMWKVRETRSLTSFMFVNMVVSDLLVTVSVMPSNINDYYNDFNWLIKGGGGWRFHMQNSAIYQPHIVGGFHPEFDFHGH